MNQKIALKILEKTRQDYNRIADHFSSTRQKRVWPDIEEFLSYIKSGDKILDVGCGNGRLLQLLSQQEVDYIGIDISESLINEAEKLWQGEKIKFIVGDILDLPFLAESFDVVFCLAVLYHIPGKDLRQKAVKNLARMVKPGGYVFITVWNLWQKKFLPDIRGNNWKKIFGWSKLDFNDFYLSWKDQHGKVVATRYCHAFRQKELEKLMQDTGLKIIQSGYSRKSEKRYNIIVIAQK